MAAPVALGADNAVELLSGRVPLSGTPRARLLAGGVSNTVVLVEDGKQRIVLKQSLPRLRVADEWLADRTRIHREWDAMVALRAILPEGRLPEPLFLDRPGFLYAMGGAPRGSRDWKTLLLAGRCDAGTARLAGETLGMIVRGTWNDPALRERFADTTAFDQLRTDPYYRTVAARHPGLAASVEEWIAESRSRRVAMVHGDWSPKNLLVHSGGIICIDFECAHFGDPSYDAGFLMNHLILKAFRRPALAGEYFRLARAAFGRTLSLLPEPVLAWFEGASARHLALLMLARVDGKSPVEYLRGEPLRDRVRSLALNLVETRPGTVEAVLAAARGFLPRADSRAAPTGRP